MRWTPRSALIALVVVNLLWAGSYTAAKESMRVLSPVELNGIRFTIAGLILLPFLWRGRSALQLSRADLPRLAMLCCCGFVLNKAAEFTGLNLTTASDTALLIASESMWTALLGWLVLHEVMHRSSIGGLLVGAIGVYIVLERGLNVPNLGSGRHLLGDGLVVLALLFEAYYTVLGKSSLDRYPGLLITAVSVLGSLVVWIPAAAINVAVAGLPHMTSTTWIGVLYMAIPSTVIGYLVWMVALRYVTATAAAATLYLQPLAGTALAVVILSERPTWGTLAGGFCIIGGVWLAGRGPSPAVAAAVAAEPLAS
jgi:drug/metabolite transporter (DMT)-like permease